MLLTLGGIITALAIAWYGLFGLKDYQISTAELETRYAYSLSHPLELTLSSLNDRSYDFTYSSFDGAIVNGRITYPAAPSTLTEPVPVLIGVHAMGRSQLRWWQDNIDGRPTLEQVDKITNMALAKGYAVVAIDARNHGLRKVPEHSIKDIYTDLHWWGKREPYEQMLIDTVRDHRVLLDWLTQQPQLDANNISIAGYSMGAQVSLLLAGVDSRIRRVAAIVPPYLGDNVAVVAPKNVLTGLGDNQVWLLTANDDEYASEKQNATLFQALPNTDKQHIRFDSDHLLPEGYVQNLEPWL